jgi:prolyl 4-hydroxylase
MKIKNIKKILIIVLVLVVIGIFWYLGKTVVEDTFETQPKGRGYCDINEDYTMPVLHRNFITPEQAQAIIAKAEPNFSKSTIVSGSDDSIRKSQTAWLNRDDPVVLEIIQKVCRLTKIPFENAEPLQVVKYGASEYYNEHYDASCDDDIRCVEFEKNGGQRRITMLLCLDDQYVGGETNFPRLNKKYKLPKGGGLLFHSLENKENGKCHPKSLHAGLPVKSGTKYIANIWLREREYV